MYFFITWHLWHCSWFPCTSLWLHSKERVLLCWAQCLGGSRVLSSVLLYHSAHPPRGAPSIPVVSRPSAWCWLQSHILVQTFLSPLDTWVCCIGWSMCISDSALAKPILGCPLLSHPPCHLRHESHTLPSCLPCLHLLMWNRWWRGDPWSWPVQTLSVHLTSLCSCYSAFIWILPPRSVSVAVTFWPVFLPKSCLPSIPPPLGYLPLPFPHYPHLRLRWRACLALKAARAPGRTNFLPEWPFSALCGFFSRHLW